MRTPMYSIAPFTTLVLCLQLQWPFLRDIKKNELFSFENAHPRDGDNNSFTIPVVCYLSIWASKYPALGGSCIKSG